jgi:hypothetical protein
MQHQHTDMHVRLRVRFARERVHPRVQFGRVAA